MAANWYIKNDRFELRLAAGVYSHEAKPQKVWATLNGKVQSHSLPTALADRLEYESVLHWMWTAWPRALHTLFLTTCINKLNAFVFAIDSRVRGVVVVLYSRNASGDPLVVGNEREANRNHGDVARALAQVFGAIHG